MRKDLALVSSGGRPKIGYNRAALIADIEQFLGYDNTNDAVLIGAGKLGRARAAGVGHVGDQQVEHLARRLDAVLFAAHEAAQILSHRERIGHGYVGDHERRLDGDQVGNAGHGVELACEGGRGARKVDEQRALARALDDAVIAEVRVLERGLRGEVGEDGVGGARIAYALPARAAQAIGHHIPYRIVSSEHESLRHGLTLFLDLAGDAIGH